MSDPLKLTAVGCQLSGFIVIFLMRTYDVAGFWQGTVLVLMLLSALLIGLRRRYERNTKLAKKQNPKPSE